MLARLRSTTGERSVGARQRSMKSGPGSVQVLLHDALGRVVEQVVGVITEQGVEVHERSFATDLREPDEPARPMTAA